MATAPPMITDPLYYAEAIAPQLPRSRRRISEVVCYWRKTEREEDNLDVATYTESRWITTADTQPGKQMDFTQRGWQMLPQYGRVIEQGAARWERILMHPKGPSEFPASQVIAYGWYRAKGLPGRCQGMKIAWPQLAGIEIEEIFCPRCRTRVFHQGWHLALHLRNAHSFSEQDIDVAAKRMGIDLDQHLSDISVRRFRFDQLEDIEAGQIVTPEADPEPLISVKEVHIEVPPGMGSSAALDDPEYANVEPEGAQMPAAVGMSPEERWQKLQETAKALGIEIPEADLRRLRRGPGAKRFVSEEEKQKLRGRLDLARVAKAAKKTAQEPVLA